MRCGTCGVLGMISIFNRLLPRARMRTAGLSDYSVFVLSCLCTGQIWKSAFYTNMQLESYTVSYTSKRNVYYTNLKLTLRYKFCSGECDELLRR